MTAFDINCNDTMAIVGTEFSSSDFSADLAFYDTRNTNLLSKFTESHGDDVTEVIYYISNLMACKKLIYHRSNVILQHQVNFCLVRQMEW